MIYHIIYHKYIYIYDIIYHIYIYKNCYYDRLPQVGLASRFHVNCTTVFRCSIPSIMLLGIHVQIAQNANACSNTCGLELKQTGDTVHSGGTTLCLLCLHRLHGLLGGRVCSFHCLAPPLRHSVECC